MNTSPCLSRELAIYEVMKKMMALAMAEVVVAVEVWQYDESVQDKGGKWGWQIQTQHEYGTGPNVDLDSENARQGKIAELIGSINFP